MAIPGATKRQQKELRRRQAEAIRRAQQRRAQNQQQRDRNDQRRYQSNSEAQRLALLQAQAEAEMQAARTAEERRKAAERLRKQADQAANAIRRKYEARAERQRADRAARIERAQRAAISARKGLRDDTWKYAKPEEDDSLLGRALRFAGDAIGAVPGLEETLELAGKPQEELAQVYHAAKYSKLQGDSLFEQLQAGIGQVPGMGVGGVTDTTFGEAWLPSKARERGEAVNTREEREALREEGQYASIGEFLTGRAENRLKGLAKVNYDGGLLDFLPDEGSGAVDAAFQVATDPLTYIPGAVARSGLSTPTRLAGAKGVERAYGGLKTLGDDLDYIARANVARNARDKWLRNTRRGRALEKEVRAAALKASDGGELQRILPGMPPTVAGRIGNAPREAAQDLASQALRSGEYVPDISMRRQALLATFGRGLKAPGGIGLGRRSVRYAQGIGDIAGHARRLGNRRKGRIARAGRLSSTAQARRGATISALRTATVGGRALRYGDARNTVAETTASMSPWDRVNEVLIASEDLPGLVSDIVENSLEKILPKSQNAVDFNRKMAALADDEDALQALLETETLIATARGDFGEDAAKQLSLELGVNFTRPREVDVHKVISRAGKRAGLAAPKVGALDNSTSDLKKLTDEIEEVGNESLEAQFKTILNNIRKGKVAGDASEALTDLRRTVGLAKKGSVADDAAGIIERYGDALAERPNLIGGHRTGLGTRLNVPRQIGRVVTSITEHMAPNQIRFLSTENIELSIQGRVEALDSYMGALNLDDQTRALFRQAAAEVAGEGELYDLVDRVLVTLADAEGLSAEAADLLSHFLSETREKARRMGFKAMQDEGELLHEVQNLSQLSEVVPLPDPSDVRKSIRKLKAAGDDPAKLEDVRKFLEDPTDAQRAARVYKFFHRNWKLMVVTNLYMPVVGGAAGFADAEGGFAERLEQGLHWGAVGSLGFTRYVIRVVGIEESARRLLQPTFTPSHFIPGISKWKATHGVDLDMMSPHLLSSGDPTGNWIRREWSTHATGEFEAMALPDQDGFLSKLSRKDSRYLDSYDRIVNRQLNDANGSLDRYLLSLRAGHITRKEFDTWLKEWYKSPDGELWWRRWRGALGGAKSKTEAFWRQHDFIWDYIPEDIARARLPHLMGDFQTVPRSLLKASMKRKETPAFIHAERTWKLPRKGRRFRDLAAMKDKATDKLIFGGPTRTMQRRPMARHIFKDEYHALIDSGVAPQRARELADRKAINTVNDVMFNMNNESRFASKVDLVFPFQQPREELVRVWAPMVFNNKIRTLQVTRLGALAFENGVSQGVFYEYDNPFGGKEWRMKVPGSATLSRALGGVNAQFDFELKDVMFISQMNASTLGIPSPGGPTWTIATRKFFDAFPQHVDSMPSWLQTYLFPFGSSGRLFRAEPNRLWMAFMGTPAPWEIANQWEQQEEYHKVQQNMMLHLYHENLKDGRVEWPSFEEIDEATESYFKAQAAIGAVWPASTRYFQPWQEMVEKAKEPYLYPDGGFDYIAFVNDNPNLAPFVASRGEYVGPDTLEMWSRADEEKANDYMKHYRERFDVREFKKMLDERREESEAWREFNQIPYENWDWETADAYIEWEEKWIEKRPDIVETSRNNYFRDRRLHNIMQMSEGAHKDRALNEWRKKYDVPYKQYKDMARRLEREGWEVNYWKYSRTRDEVVDYVRKAARRNDVDEEVILEGLNPAEQVKYWQAKQARMSYFTGEEDDIQDFLDDYKRYRDRVSDLYKKYPKLAGDPDGDRRKDNVTRLLENWRGNVREQISALYDEINLVSARFDELKAQGKQWSAEGQALYEKRSALYDMVEEVKNRQFQELPIALLIQQDVYAATALLRDGQKPTRAFLRAMQAIMTRGIGNGGYVPSNEELYVLNMPDDVREAYTDDLIQSLNKPAVRGTKGKLYWEWLSDFQRDFLERNLPASMIRKWKAVSPEDATSGGGGYKGYGSNYGYYKPRSSKSVELSYAYELFDQYNQRPEGAKPPAAYQEYLDLPANPVIRNDFLDKHPEVADWISKGPMANMPTHLRYIVQNIMVKYGKWEGEVLDDQAITDLSFAREQLKRWNRRGDLERPDTYDKWLQMPTGVAKAQYLKKHPEIQQWLRLGPMANMPDAYQDVIRDIMVRYGEWTQEGDDSLGKVITGYYKTPAYARDQYLEEHPELTAYWAAIRSPEEQKMAAKVDQYFSLTDPNARQMFLITNPEVRQHFVDQRTKRYENFLHQVAIYMGSNPDLFTKYLERQEDVINDLLLRFAQPNLLREVGQLTDAETTDRQRRRG